jgi:hypothetical protein
VVVLVAALSRMLQLPVVARDRRFDMMSKRSLAIYSLVCALFLTIAGSAYKVAFSLQPTIQFVQQGIPGLGIPGQEQQQPQQQQQPQLPPPSLPPPSISTPPAPPAPPASSPEVIPQQQQGPNQGIIAHGVIDSLILTPTATWIAAGNWTIGVNNGNAALVTANMTWYNDNGTSSHTHEILNFRPFAAGQQSAILVQPDNNSVSLRGVVDVGANHRISWNGVQSAIDVKKGGKILSISLDDAQTNNHFGGRPIFGIVTSFTRCSDVPGPNMEMLQPCLNIPIPPPVPSAAAPLPPSTASPVSPPPSPALSPPTISANNTIQNPTNPPTSSPPSVPSLSTPPGNITTGRSLPSVPPAVTSNATGKSPFDVLGGG